MKKLRGFLQRLVNRPIWMIGGLSVLSLALISKPVFAANPLDYYMDFVTGRDLIKGLFHMIFGMVGLIAGALSNLFVLIINTVILPGQNSLFFGTGDQATIVKKAFDGMLSIANILFFITLVIFAIMIITRQSGYNFKKAITALITAIVLANISYPLVQVLIELGDSLRNTGTALFGGSMNAGALSTWLNSMAVLAPEILDPSASVAKFIMLEFASMATQLILAYVFFRLMAVLVERAIRLVALTIFAPIQAVLGIFPQKDLQIGGNWISEVIKWVMVLPVVFILLGIAKQIMPADTPAAIKSVLQIVMPSEANAGTSTPTIAGLLFQIILGLGIMAAAANVPALLKLPISAATKFMTDTIGNAPGKWAGQSLKKAAGTQTALIGEKFKNTRFGNAVTTPFRTASIKQEAAEKQLKAIRGAREIGQTSQANALNLKAGIETKKQHDAARDAWYSNNQYGDAATWDDLEPPEQEMMLRKFHQQNPSWKQRFDAAKKMRIAANLDDINPVAEADLGIENLKNFTDTALQGLAREGSNPTDLAKGGVRGNFGALDRLAHRAGKNYDPAREAINKLLFEKDANGNYDKNKKTPFYALLKDAGYEWTPKAPYQMSGKGAVEVDEEGNEEDAEEQTVLSAPSAPRSRGSSPTARITSAMVQQVVNADLQFNRAQTTNQQVNQEIVDTFGRDAGDIKSRLENAIGQLGRTKALDSNQVIAAIASGLSDRTMDVVDQLPSELRDEIDEIAKNTTLSDDEKVGKIRGALTQKNNYFSTGATAAQDADAVANTVGRSGGMDQWTNLKNLTNTVRATAASSTVPVTQISQLVQKMSSSQRNLNQATAAKATVEQQINVTASTNNDAYVQAVSAYRQDNPAQAAQLPDQLREFKSALLKAVEQTKLNITDDSGIGDLAGVDRTLVQKIATLADQTKTGSALDATITDWTDLRAVGEVKLNKAFDWATRLEQAHTSPSSGQTPPKP